MRLPAALLGLTCLTLVSATASADEDKKFAVGGDLLLLVPVGDLSDGTGVLLGPVVRGGYRVLPPLEVTARIGYLFGFHKSVIAGASTSVDDLPIWAGARYFFLDPDSGPYAGGEIGLNVLRAKVHLSDAAESAIAGANAAGVTVATTQTEARLGFNLQAGYVISKELPIDFKVQLSYLNLLGKSDGEGGLIGIGFSAGYTYRF